MNSVPNFQIILDEPEGRSSHSVEQTLGRTLGRLLIGIALLATTVAVPATIMLAGFSLTWIGGNGAGAAKASPWNVPATELALAWAISMAIAAVALRSGLWFVRRDRGVVLFLRRFRYDDATRVVSFAVSTTIGSRWRIVTLDDAEITPMGASEAARRLFAVGGVAWRRFSSLSMALGLRLFPAVVMAAWLVVALEVFIAPSWNAFLNSGTAERYMHALTAVVLNRSPPITDIGPSLPGIFALLVTVGTGAFVIMIITGVAALFAVPLAGVIAFLSSSARAVDAAERAKTIDVCNVDELDHVANDITTRQRTVLIPRLTVLRVSPEIWQLAVQRIAASAGLVVIDVSEPTENVLWEIAELQPAFGARCIFIGQHDRLRALAAVQHAPDGSLHERCMRVLHGRAILAYTTDIGGSERFARALGVTLSRVAQTAGGSRGTQTEA
jgi:hypothetical protein